MDKTRTIPKRFKIPKFEIEDIEDSYTYYVLILGISEDVFWNCDINFILSVVENKSAYDGFVNYMEYREYEKSKKSK